VQTDDFFSGELIPHSRRVSLDAIEGQSAGAAKNAENRDLLWRAAMPRRRSFVRGISRRAASDGDRSRQP
jgi:hypothetical protein